MQVSEIFAKVCYLAIALGHKNIRTVPGCLEIQVDEHRWFALNPHSERTMCSHSEWVPAGTIYLKFRDWPAGMVTARSGSMIGIGAGDEDSLIDSLDAAIARAKAGNAAISPLRAARSGRDDSGGGL